ncbi:hypothetical protein ZWY2020_010505 [Hordeum vulgare]|nr:hypothetical protein ZWY2020_010505 [Hordeum vulgare]
MRAKKMEMEEASREVGGGCTRGELGWRGPHSVAGEEAAEGEGAAALQPRPQHLNPFLQRPGLTERSSSKQIWGRSEEKGARVPAPPLPPPAPPSPPTPVRLISSPLQVVTVLFISPPSPQLSSTTPAVFHHDFRRLLPPARARSRPRLPVSTHETHELASAYLFARIHQ